MRDTVIRIDETPAEKAIKSGTRGYCYRGSADCDWSEVTHFAVYPASMSDDEIYEVWPGIAEGHYSGPGRSFSNPVFLRRFGSRVLATQSAGIDI